MSIQFGDEIELSCLSPNENELPFRIENGGNDTTWDLENRAKSLVEICDQLILHNKNILRAFIQLGSPASEILEPEAFSRKR